LKKRALDSSTLLQMCAHDYLGNPPKAKGLVGEIEFFVNSNAYLQGK
jgi:hypothetical protein